MRRTHGVEVQIRVGLNSGEVVVRAIGSDLHMDYSAIGQTTHLAARMEQLATPGSIRLTAETLRLAEGLVQVTALGPVPVKGLAEPVEVFELVGARACARAPAGGRRAAGPHALCRPAARAGAAPRQALAPARAGHGQVVAAVGEPGVGKSRLVLRVLHSHRTHGWLVLEAPRCRTARPPPTCPVIDLLKRYFHVESRDDPRTIREKVTGQVLTLDHGAPGDDLRRLLWLLDALPDDQPVLDARPPQRRQRTLDAVKRLLLPREPGPAAAPGLRGPALDRRRDADPARQPRREPAHGAHPAPGQLPPRVPATPGAARRTTRNSGSIRCRPTSADELLETLLGRRPPVSAPLKRLLIERTGGNPFFLEESVRALVETAALVGERGAYRLARPSTA